MSNGQPELHGIITDVVDKILEESSATSGLVKMMRRLESDHRGEVGEVFMHRVLNALGHDVERDRKTDATHKHWDLLVDGNVKLEVKTASLGSKNKTFQHENLKRHHDFDALVLVDIAPTALYVTMARKDTLPWSTPNSNWTKNARAMLHRHDGTAHKWTFNLKDVESRRVETLGDVAAMYDELALSIQESA